MSLLCGCSGFSSKRINILPFTVPSLPIHTRSTALDLLEIFFDFHPPLFIVFSIEPLPRLTFRVINAQMLLFVGGGEERGVIGNSIVVFRLVSNAC